MIKEVNDNTIFWFGREYKGLPMNKIKDSYLMWFYNTHKDNTDFTGYINYIKRNMYNINMREKWWNEMKLKH